MLFGDKVLLGFLKVRLILGKHVLIEGLAVLRAKVTLATRKAIEAEGLRSIVHWETLSLYRVKLSLACLYC